MRNQIKIGVGGFCCCFSLYRREKRSEERESERVENCGKKEKGGRE